MPHSDTVFHATDYSSGGNKNKVVLAVTIVLAIICAGLRAWLLYILCRPCKASSCGSKQTTAGAKSAVPAPTTQAKPAVPAPTTQAKPEEEPVDDALTSGDSTLTSGGAADADEDEEGDAVAAETEDLSESAVRSADREDAAAAAQRAGDALGSNYVNEEGQLVEDRTILTPSDDLEAIIAGEASGARATDAMTRLVPASRSAPAAAPTSVGFDDMHEEIFDAAGMTAQIPMTDEDEARARAAFDVDSRMPASFFETAEQTSGRLADEAKLRALAEQHPDRAAELLQNVSGAFHPTQDQLSRLRAAQGSMRPTMLYVPENDPSKGLYAALRPPVALPKTDMSFEFNAPMAYVSAQAASMQ